MTISTTSNRVTYTGNGTTTVFAVPYSFFSETDLVVLSTVIATGVQTVKTLTTDYTVSGIPDTLFHYPDGGTVTFVDPPASTERITIYRDPPQTQDTDLVENDSLPAESTEAEFDYLTMLSQRNRDLISRTLRQPEGDSEEMALIPAKVDRASKYLAFDSNGDPQAVDPATASGTSVTITGGTEARLLADRFADAPWVEDYGPTGLGDDTATIQAAILATISSGYHKPLRFRNKLYTCLDTITIDVDTDPAASTSHRNMVWIGAGGMGTEPGTEIRFNVSDAAKNGLEILSAFGVEVIGIALTSNTAIKNVVLIAANVSPAFSGSLIHFENCYFNSFANTPAEAVIQAVNNKLVSVERCWLGVRAAGDTCMILGGNEADNAAYLQEGELDNFELHNCFVFGVCYIKKCRNFEVKNNTFVESYESRLDVTGDEDSHGGVIEANYFSGVSSDTEPEAAVTVGDFTSAGGEEAGCIRIANNRFRYRDLGIRVKSITPVIIEANHFRARSAASVGIQIDSTAEKVVLGANDFDDMYAVSALAIDDQRYTAWTDQPTNNVNKDIVADFVLSAADTSISATNTTQLIGSVTNVSLRGGKYRVRVCVSVRNTDVTDSLPFEVLFKYRDQGNTLHSIGVIGQTYVGADDGQYIAGSGRGSLYLERIVYLGGTTDNTPTLSGFELYVKNLSGAGTPASGQVDGGATELGDQILTWFQVEEYRD